VQAIEDNTTILKIKAFTVDTQTHTHKTLQREATVDGKGILKGWVL